MNLWSKSDEVGNKQKGNNFFANKKGKQTTFAIRTYALFIEKSLLLFNNHKFTWYTYTFWLTIRKLFKRKQIAIQNINLLINKERCNFWGEKRGSSPCWQGLVFLGRSRWDHIHNMLQFLNVLLFLNVSGLEVTFWCNFHMTLRCFASRSKLKHTKT